MQITVTHTLPNARALESSAFTATASFYDDSWVAASPTTARYRIDNPYNDTQIVGWTTLTPAASISIPITATNNAIVSNCSSEEPRQITVQANTGLSTQTQAIRNYWITNLSGQT